MTTKELINQYVTAHAENRWMDASELEALLTEFAEKLKEPVNKDLVVAVIEQMEDDGDVDYFVRKGIDDIVLKYAALGAQWQKEQMMNDAVEVEVSDDWQYGKDADRIAQPAIKLRCSELKIGQKVKVIIIKE